MRLGWTIVYVRSVEAAVRVSRRAFGLELRFIANEKQYAEMETGATALSFASNHFAGTDLPLPIRENDPDEPPAGFTISVTSDDVQADYDHALAAGATALAAPEVKPWGQTVAYVRDPDGVLIELATPIESGG